MSVRINIDENRIQAIIDNSWKNGLEMLSTQVLRDCNLYCKQDTGMLIMSSYIHSKLDKGQMIWQTPYAARQYYEIQTAYKDVNQQASWRWVEVAKNNHYEDWVRQAQAIVRLYR